MVQRLVLIALLVYGCVSALTLGAGPLQAADWNVKDLIFVSGRTSQEIAAIDTRSETIVARYSLPGVPKVSIATGKTKRLLTVTYRPRAIHVIDLETGRLSGSPDPGFEPTRLQLTDDGTRLAAVGPGRIVIVNVLGGRIERDVRYDGSPSVLIFDKPGNFLLIGDGQHQRIHMLDMQRARGLSTLDLADETANGGGIVSLARTPGGGTAMAIDARGNGTLLDLKSHKIMGHVALPGSHERIFPTVNSQYFLVPNLGKRTISMISTWTNRESERLRTGQDTTALNTFLADMMLMVFAKDSPTAEVFDLDRKRRMKRIRLPGRTIRTVSGPGGLKAYIIFGGIDAVAAIDVGTLRVAKVVQSIGFVPGQIFSAGGLSFCH